MTKQPPGDAEQHDRGEHNELSYRIVDEQGEYDERGSQGPGGPAREHQDDGSPGAERRNG
jgi:hypothetical protein